MVIWWRCWWFLLCSCDADECDLLYGIWGEGRHIVQGRFNCYIYFIFTSFQQQAFLIPPFPQNCYFSSLTWMAWAVECWSGSSPASSWSYFCPLTRCWPSFSWCSCGQWGTPCLQEGQGWKSGCLFSPGSWECEDRRSSFHASPCWGALWRLEARESRAQRVSTWTH